MNRRTTDATTGDSSARDQLDGISPLPATDALAPDIAQTAVIEIQTPEGTRESGPELVVDRYELRELVGTGGTADVYCAHDTRLNRLVALKVMHEPWSRDPDRVERFDREARAAASLNHPHIVSLLDRGAWEGRPFIVFEYLGDEDLSGLIRREGPLPVGRAIELAIEIGRGLAFAHKHGVVHRDVKPQNVLLSRGRAKVTDFGLARAADTDELTVSGSILGTSQYISPEQASGKVADERSDVYSLGVVLFEMLTGTVPFEGDGFMDVAQKRLSEPAPSVGSRRRDISPRIAGAVARALAIEPRDRFGSMDEFIAELAACLPRSEDWPTATTVSPALGERPRGRDAGPKRSTAAALAVILVCAVAAVVVLLRSSARVSAHLGPAVVGPSALRAVGAYDPPPGDGVEDNQSLRFATDGNPATAWATEWYANDHFGGLKSGVGIVLTTGKPVLLGAVTVLSDTPGYQMIVKAGPTPTGPFQAVSQLQTGSRKTQFALHGSSSEPYYLLWITRLSPATGPHFEARINEVSAAVR